MLLQDRTAVVYGAGGHVGGAVARAMAAHGAHVVLTGRTRSPLESVAAEVSRAGGSAEVATVDALDAGEVDRHLEQVLAARGRVDVSFNAVWIRGDLQGRRLVDMPVEDFLTPVVTAASTHFLTATAAARRMIGQGSGVVITLSSSASRLSARDQGFHATGGFAVACGAVETFTRNLAGEVGPHGVRVVCLRSDALPETWPAEDPGADGRPESPVKAYMEEGSALRRLPSLAQVADAAVFLASDAAGAVTGTVLNVSCGSVLD